MDSIAMNGAVGPFIPEAVDRLYTEELAALYLAVMALQEERNEPYVDGDPITGHQEYCPLEQIRFSSEAFSETEVSVTVSFMSQRCFDEAPPAIREEVTEIDFHVVQVGGEWRIDDFEHSLYGSFRAFLEQFK